MKLVAASLTPPNGLEEMLNQLAEGEAGFSGSTFYINKLSMPDFLQECIDMSQGKNLPEGFVPQTTFWIVIDDEAVGTVRVRHHLNDFLKTMGGHIGYYVKPSARGNGYATKALELALIELKKIGQDKALITVNPDNHASNKTIQKCGGVFTQEFVTNDGATYNHYWIDL